MDLPIEDVAARANSALQATASGDGVSLSDAAVLGVLGRDENAIYTGIVLQVDMPDYSDRVAGAAALTLVRGHVVTYVLYDSFVDESTFATLVARLQPVMAGLVAANGTPADVVSSGGSRFDWQRIVYGAIGGVLAAGLATLLLRRRRRRSG
ncbi:MAG: hypothetical protein R3F55_09865 [Alphaproteobacteria bacterium]